MTPEHYRKKAECFAGLLLLAISEKDFSQVETYLTAIKKAIEDMRKAHKGQL